MGYKGIDRRGLYVRLTVKGVASDVPEGVTLYEGLQYIVGADPTGAFASATAGQIAEYNGTKWVFSDPKTWRMEVFDEAANAIKRWDGSAWVNVAELVAKADISDMETKTNAADTYVTKTYATTNYATKAEVTAAHTCRNETHVITAAEVAAKAFDLDYAVKDADEANTFVRFESVDQNYGSDFTVVANNVTGKDAISWAADGDKTYGLAELDIRAGDVFKIQYNIEVEE